MLNCFNKGPKPNNRFEKFLADDETEEIATSDNTSSISDFSFGAEKWSAKKITKIFEQLQSEKNHKRTLKIIEKGLHMIVYEVPDKPDLVIQFVAKGLELINYEKGILESIKRLRILEESDAS